MEAKSHSWHKSFGGEVSVILYKVFCMLAGKILWHWWATTKRTTSYSISKYFTIMLCTIYYKWGYSLSIKKIMTCVVQQDMTHEQTELWMCFLLDYDVFTQLGQKQLLSSIRLNVFFVLLSWFVPLITWIFITFCFALKWSATVLNT